MTYPNGKVEASLGGVTTLPIDKNLAVVQEAAKAFPKQSTGFLLQNDELYQISVTPVFVDSTHGQGLLNVFVAGYRVDALVAQRLKERTGSEFLVLTPAGVIASTLNPRATEAVVAKIRNSRGAAQVSDGVVQASQRPRR